jgi:hypothetical protein
MLRVNERFLRERTEWSLREDEVHALSSGCTPHTIAPGDRRKLALSTIVGARCAGLGELGESGGTNKNQFLALLGHWLGEIRVFRFLIRSFDDRCFHVSSSLFRVLFSPFGTLTLLEEL